MAAVANHENGQPRPHMLSQALYYAGAGVRVFPLEGKLPLFGSHGFHDATTDRAQVEALWTKHPDAGIGTPDWDVVDVDLYKPECEETWKRVRPLIPAGTPCNRTGGGGLQFIFVAGTLRDGRIGPGVDCRYAQRNYIVLPPSRHPNGNHYQWDVSPLTNRPKPAPQFPYESASRNDKAPPIGDTIPNGERDCTLTSLAGTMRRRGMNAAEIVAALTAVNTERCETPLPGRDLERIARSVCRYDPAAPGRDGQPRALSATPISEAAMRSIRFLERPLWQRAAFELLAGAKGAGKGTYLAGFAARLSRQGYASLFVTSEDSIELDLKPRLVAAGADLDRVLFVAEHVRLPGDIDELHRLGDEIENLALLTIDPVANHIGDRNSNNEAEVRDAIAPLNKLADELDCLIVGVRHPGKDRSRGAVASILGSTAWVDTPRAVVMIVADDEDADVRHIQVVAGNRTRGGNAQSFRIDEAAVAGLEEPVTLAVELGESDKSVDTLLNAKAPDSKSASARELILDILDGEGQQESDTLDARVTRETGLASQTVRNVRAVLKNEGLIKAVPDKDEFGAIARWMVKRTHAPRL